jgi:hypothetical protein
MRLVLQKKGAERPVSRRFFRLGDPDLAGSDRDTDISPRSSATVHYLGATGVFITVSRVPIRATRRSPPWVRAMPRNRKRGMDPAALSICLGPFSGLPRLMCRTNLQVGILQAPRLQTQVFHCKKVCSHQCLMYCANTVQGPGHIALLRSSTLLPLLSPSYHKGSAPIYASPASR